MKSLKIMLLGITLIVAGHFFCYVGNNTILFIVGFVGAVIGIGVSICGFFLKNQHDD